VFSGNVASVGKMVEGEVGISTAVRSLGGGDGTRASGWALRS